MMHNIVLCLFVTDILYLQTVKSDQISSKLDFGQDDDHNADRIIKIKSPEKLANLEILQPEGTTVLCSITGCNKTETEKGDIVSDVVVHVKTSVNVPKARNETIEETPDVPVVLGYGKSNPQFIPESLVNSNPIVVSNFENSYPTRAHESKIQPQLHRKYYMPVHKQVSYDTNFLYVPYLEPSFHKYHFGESPPLQYMWMPKGGASFNPVEFKRFERPTWNKVQWNRPNGPLPSHTETSGYTTCTCHNPGLNWYPTTSTWNIQSPNLNTHIDDKLAPLN